jgi:hypothetical protein
MGQQRQCVAEPVGFGSGADFYEVLAVAPVPESAPTPAAASTCEHVFFLLKNLNPIL